VLDTIQHLMTRDLAGMDICMIPSCHTSLNENIFFAAIVRVCIYLEFHSI
jgi:hypothetical protein